MDRLKHDCGFTAAMHLMETFGPLMREEERRDGFEVCYTVCVAAIESYLIQRNRELQRLQPTSN